MIFEQMNIHPNITVNLLKTSKFKSNYVSVNFIRPLQRKTAPYYVLISRILKRGCKQFPTQKLIAKRLEELYGADIFYKNSKCGDLQILGFGADMLDNAYSMDSTDITTSVLDLLMNIILSPLQENGNFSELFIRTEKEKQIDYIKSKINNKNKYAVDRCKSLMCKNEVYGISESGTVEDFLSMDDSQLIFQYQEILSQSKIEVYFIGNFEMENIIPLIQPLTSVSSSTPLCFPERERVLTSHLTKTYEEAIDAVQGKLSMGFRSGITIDHPQYAHFPVFLEVFGASPTSKLFMNVREKLSLCYYCSAMADSVKGIMIVSAGIKNENKDSAEREIATQLRAIAQGDISDEELYCAKKSLHNLYLSIYDTPSALENWYLTRSLCHLHISPSEMKTAIENVTKADLSEIAKKITLDTIYFMKGTQNEKKGDHDHA